MSALKVNYKNDVLNVETNTKRKYNIIENADGTISLEDVTDYSQVGDDFGGEDINNTNSHLVADDGNGNTLDFQFATDGTDYGYLDANGNFAPFRTRHTDTYSPTSRANNLDMGIFHTKRFVDTTAVPNINDETQTISAVYTSGNGLDLGATNRKRYIKTSGLMVTPTATKSITANGSNIDILNYAKVNVSVPSTKADVAAYFEAYSTESIPQYIGRSRSGSNTTATSLPCQIGIFKFSRNGGYIRVTATESGTYAYMSVHDNQFVTPTTKTISANDVIFDITKSGSSGYASGFVVWKLPT